MLLPPSVPPPVSNHGLAKLPNQHLLSLMYSEFILLLAKQPCMLDMNQQKEKLSLLGGEAEPKEIQSKISLSSQNPMPVVDAEFMLGSTSTIGQLRETL